MDIGPMDIGVKSPEGHVLGAIESAFSFD